jgi:hypothetical protein
MAGETSGISNKIQLLKETDYDDGGVAGEVIAGVTKSFSWNAETSSVLSYGLEGDGASATHIIDGVQVITGSHEFELTNFDIFEAILGSKVGDNYRVTKVLPSYAVKVVDEGGATEKKLLISGIKYGKFSINISRENPITVTADWIGRKIVDTGTFVPSVSDVEPLIGEDACFLTGTAPATGLDNITVEIDRGNQGVRFLDCNTTGNRRLISKIIEKILAVTGNGSITGQRQYVEEILGGSTQTDLRTDKDYTVRIKRGSIDFDINFKGARFQSVDTDYNKENDLSLMNFALLSKNIEINKN